MEHIGKRLSYVRKNIFKLNQKDFSNLIGVSQGALSDIENGNRGLSMEALIYLCKYSKGDNSFSFSWLLLGEGEPLNLEVPLLTDDEQELLNSYRLLDNRGRHIIHATIYQELDRNKLSNN
ncbi:hypothetical protein GCM10023142_23380 [Anaerocolumna aminovalerica]|uniref:Helix-turn-helix domain-containing protein n=1 Tax=Anaerocolumna aminovalerica TaxID=1527 RepID=A0A1I5GJS2_9FIRM|nr:helix-turn-helix transcriptional regulator [Anaerocolumna aminovalerica]MBU5334385.1 helix-turn-helix domain-containing protein [Anaerocolumna aminovalerica]SFO36248.1 Helix-turn-helix domain-containing protein [Anaerocolumna aminovalerica]